MILVKKRTVKRKFSSRVCAIFFNEQGSNIFTKGIQFHIENSNKHDDMALYNKLSVLSYQAKKQKKLVYIKLSISGIKLSKIKLITFID